MFQDSEAGSAAWLADSADDRFALLPPGERATLELLARPDWRQIDAQIRGVGACEQPIWLTGRTLVIAVASGAVIDRFASDDKPFGAIAVRCMNRRATRCKPCSLLYKQDAFQLLRAGLSGGKGVPDSIRDHPMVFATLTAPSFGPVHRRPDPSRPGDRCRPRRDDPRCDHGAPLGCPTRHGPDDPAIGQPMCAACYDYPGHVLFNAMASRLWHTFAFLLYRRLARVGGVRNAAIRKLVRVEYVRLAEYQARGLVHFHVALRLDGPADRQPPPSWATSDSLAEAVRSAARSVSVAVPESNAVGSYALRFGAQLDARPIVLDGTGFASEKAAGYMAKYVTKGTEDARGSDVPITHRSQIDPAARTAHVRALMHTAWTLGQLPEFRALGLHRWTHMLGFGGHVLSATRHYSTTMGALRQVRADFRAHQTAETDAETVRDRLWQYAGRGWPTDTIAEQAAAIAEDIEINRQLAREALELERAQGGGEAV